MSVAKQPYWCSIMTNWTCALLFLLVLITAGFGATRAFAASGPPAITNVRDCAQVTAVADYFFKFDPQERGDAITLGSQGVATVTTEICAALAGSKNSTDIRLLLDDLCAREDATLTQFVTIVQGNGALDRLKASGANSDDMGLYPERYMGAADAAKVRAILFEEAKIGAKARIIGWILFSAYGVQYVPK